MLSTRVFQAWRGPCHGVAPVNSSRRANQFPEQVRNCNVKSTQNSPINFAIYSCDYWYYCLNQKRPSMKLTVFFFTKTTNTTMLWKTSGRKAAWKQKYNFQTVPGTATPGGKYASQLSVATVFSWICIDIPPTFHNRRGCVWVSQSADWHRRMPERMHPWWSKCRTTQSVLVSTRLTSIVWSKTEYI